MTRDTVIAEGLAAVYYTGVILCIRSVNERRR